MSFVKCLLILVLCPLEVATIGLPSCLFGRRLWLFGDSLSAVDDLVNNPNRYWSYGRRSNGMLWPEWISNYTGDIMDLAYVGATASGLPGINLTRVVDHYLRLIDRKRFPAIHPLDSVAIWLGANDISAYANNDDDPTKPDMTETEYNWIMGNFSVNIQKLAAKGARRFFIFYLPDLGLFPIARGFEAKYATAITKDYNTRLHSALQTIQASVSHWQAVIYTVDIWSIMNQVVLHQSPNHEPWKMDSCLRFWQFRKYLVDYPCPDYFWMDDVHPSREVHQMIAPGILEEMCAFHFIAPSLDSIPTQSDSATMYIVIGFASGTAVIFISVIIIWCIRHQREIEFRTKTKQLESQEVDSDQLALSPLTPPYCFTKDSAGDAPPSLAETFSSLSLSLTLDEQLLTTPDTDSPPG